MIRNAILSLIFSFFAYFWISPEAFDSAASGLLTFFSILAGLVAQSMVFTAMLVSPDKLQAEKMMALKVALERQQKFWLKQFQLYIVVCLSIVVWTIGMKQWEHFFRHHLVGSLFMTANFMLITYSAMSAFSFPGRVLGLQRLRFDVIEDERKSRPVVDDRPVVDGRSVKEPVLFE